MCLYICVFVFVCMLVFVFVFVCLNPHGSEMKTVCGCDDIVLDNVCWISIFVYYPLYLGGKEGEERKVVFE